MHALVCAGVQHTSSVHTELSLPVHLWLSCVIQFDGNELKQCMGTLQAARDISQSLSPCSWASLLSETPLVTLFQQGSLRAPAQAAPSPLLLQ